MMTLRIVMFATALTAAFGVMADTNTAQTAHQKLIKEHREFVLRTGGYVVKPDAGNKAVVIANAQKRVPVKVFRRTLGYLRFATRINFDLRDMPAIQEPYAKVIKETNAAVLVVVVDKAGSTSPVVLSPDERWAVVNVAALAADDPGEAVLQSRFRTALSRAVCYSCGGASSKNKVVPTAPMPGGIGDYDQLMAESLAPDQIAFMSDYLFELGSRPIVRATYDVACQQGWAPAPSNKVQQAVWDKVHTAPKAPMKIEFDPKKGR